MALNAKGVWGNDVWENNRIVLWADEKTLEMAEFPYAVPKQSTPHPQFIIVQLSLRSTVQVEVGTRRLC